MGGLQADVASWAGCPQASSPVVMTGCQRSGTTYLARLLKESSRGAFGVEDGVIRLALQWFDWALRNREILAFARFNEFADLFLNRPNGAVLAARLHDVLSALQGNDDFVALVRDGRTEQVIRAISYGFYAGGRGQSVQFWGDKYPEYLLQLDHINAVFPTAKYIFIQRNPLATVEALMRKLPQRTGTRAVGKYVFSAADCARQWAIWNRQWQAFAGTIPVERKLEIVYEDFIRNPRDVVAGMEAFLGVTLLDEARVAAHLDDLDPGRLERFRQSADIVEIEAACALPEVQAVARQLGY